MIGRAIGHAFAVARDALARVLIRLGVTPDALTVAGMILTACAGVCYALAVGKGFALSLDPHAERGAFLLLGASLVVLSSACDMLDGAVARLGGRGTRFGAFLDSTLDRYSDFAVYAGLAAGFAMQTPANVTFVLLSMLAMFNAFMISYTRARAEDLIDRCRVGYWQRGERSAAVLIGSFAHNIPALVMQQAVLPMLTVIRRIAYTRSALTGGRPVEDVRTGSWWLRIRLWRWPRATWPYDVVTGLNIAWLVFARLPAWDVLRAWFMAG
jgi:CDP-diacylglycerol--glycerol-3-phosphate 3-phosphatidyltransferase